MNRSLSVYLDLLRLVAALAVFLGHTRSLIMPGMPVIIGAQAAESVAVFFVLSGFVIGYVAETKETGWRSYAIARASRMYSVAVLSIVVTFAADAIGSRGNADLYQSFDSFNQQTSLTDVLSYLTFTNEIWFRAVVVGSNQPFWSLGYEVAYYLLFGLATYLTGTKRILSLILGSVLVGPMVLAYLPLWLMGVWTYRLMKLPPPQDLRKRDLMGAGLVLAGAVLFVLVRFVALKHVDDIFVFNGLQSFALSIAHFYLVGAAVALNILGTWLLTFERDIWSDSATRVIRWTAGASFTLYLMHLPILFAITAWFPQVRQTGPGLLAIGAILLIILALAEFGERRKKVFEALFTRLLRTRDREAPEIISAPSVATTFPRR
jgi:peptidoglycan/LPS O-acetylase OafA/YrhL